MNKALSKDGTPIAFERSGSGPALILIDGALCYRSFGPAPHAIEREVEDIAALVKEAGGSAYVNGISSGAALALEAANRINGIKKLALYEAPFIVDDSRAPVLDDWTRIKEAIAGERPGDALKHFMKLVGMPGFLIALMRFMPAWSKLKTVAHTLRYDGALMEEHQKGKPLPRNRWTSVTIPTLAVAGGKSPAWMRSAMQALADVLPSATHRTLEGQTHMVKPKVLAPVLVEFFQ